MSLRKRPRIATAIDARSSVNACVSDIKPLQRDSRLLMAHG